MRAIILKTFRILIRVFGILFFCYLAFAGGWKDVTIGRVHRLAEESFLPPDAPGGVEVTEARIYLLAGTEDQATKETFPGGFTIYGKTTLTGDELAAFMEAWEFQTVSASYTAGMCHAPPYGFRLYHGSKLVREISICWNCRNFRFTPWPYFTTKRGFNPDSERGKNLLAFCDKRLPYYRPAPKPQKTAVP